MDEVDRAIIELLHEDARIPNSELAKRVGLSPSPCLRRVRNLETSGVITGYRATVDPEALGQGFQVMVHVNMMVKNRQTIAAFEAGLLELAEVVECRRMFGDPDYLLWVALPDTAAYERFYMSKLLELPGIGRASSQFTMKVVKGS